MNEADSTSSPAKKKTGRPKFWTQDKREELRERLEAFIEEKQWLYLGDFCARERVAWSTLEEFARSDSLFQSTFAHAKITQESRLVNLALLRKIDGHFLRFLLLNRAEDWKEKPDLAITSINNTTQVTLGELLDKVDGKSKQLIELPPSPSAEGK